MNEDTLKRANEIDRELQELQNTLNYFECDANSWLNRNRADNEKLPPRWISINPQLILEFDSDNEGSQIKIPKTLNGYLINKIKDALYDSISELTTEFNNL